MKDTPEALVNRRLNRRGQVFRHYKVDERDGTPNLYRRLLVAMLYPRLSVGDRRRARFVMSVLHSDDCRICHLLDVPSEGLLLAEVDDRDDSHYAAPHVVYVSLKKWTVWARPAEEFHGMVDVNGERVQRFTALPDVEDP